MDHPLDPAFLWRFETFVGTKGHFHANAIGPAEAIGDLRPEFCRVIDETAGGRLEPTLREIGANQEYSLGLHLLELRVGETKTVLDGIDASVDGILRGFAGPELHG